MLLDFTRTGFLPTKLWLDADVLGRPVLAVSLGTAFYLSLVKLLRFQRVRALKRKYGDGPQPNPGKHGTATRPVAGRPDVTLKPEEAQEILLRVTQLEMPGLMRFALVFALFKTYAIPTISEILLQSKQLSTAEGVARRFSDTGILISTWLGCPFIDLTRMNLKTDEVDPRHAIAIARVNWLHSRWPNIKNEDLIYTLSLFVLEPIRWAKLYGWRELLPIEQEVWAVYGVGGLSLLASQALFVMWKEIGRRMNIQDVPETLPDLAEWAERYEEIAMIPAESNYKVGQYTLDYVVSNVRDVFGMRKFVREIAICLIEPRIRTAFMLPGPSPWMQTITRALMSYFAIKARYFDLPRFKRVRFVSREVPAEKYKEKQPRFHPTQFDRVPWYKPEPKGLARLWQNVQLKVGLLEEEYVPGPKFKSEGYRLEECGPIALEQGGGVTILEARDLLIDLPKPHSGSCRSDENGSWNTGMSGIGYMGTLASRLLFIQYD